jgi:predicted Rossmann fold nucleotide-binding protein DprA/Smf involved in DNA uptake
MMISENTKAVLLLTTFFNSKEMKQYKPLTENGYGYLACWLSQNGFKPEELLKAERFDSIFDLWDNPLSHTKPRQMTGFAGLNKTIADITYERLHALISRGTSLSIALDKWTSAGIWILDRQHPLYPKSLKTHLKHKCPALFFGVGNIDLLNNPSIGFVGSRDCTQEDIDVTQEYVEAVNKNGFQIVSGAAKGIDSESMLAAIDNGNSAIGIMADSLYRASGSGQWRQALRNNQLVLISPFYPEASFKPQNAMARNKYIYMLSQSTVVVCSSTKGGTWEGAKEDLKQGWVPLLVSTHAEPLQAGNKALLAGGGVSKPVIDPKPVSVDSIIDILSQKQESNGFDAEKSKEKNAKTETSEQKNEIATPQQRNAPQGELFASPDDDSAKPIDVQKITVAAPREQESITPPAENLKTSEELDTSQKTFDENIERMPLLSSFYQQLIILIESSDNKIISEEAIAQSFIEFEIISKTALHKWLKHLTELGLIERPNSRKKEYSFPITKRTRLGEEK